MNILSKNVNRKWLIILLPFILIVSYMLGNINPWISQILFHQQSNNESKNILVEIFKVIITPIITIFGVWSGSFLTTNYQSKHLKTQIKSNIISKWRTDFIDEVTKLVEILKKGHTVKALMQMAVKEDNEEKIKIAYENVGRWVIDSLPIANQSLTKIQLLLNKNNLLHKKLVNKINEIILTVMKNDFMDNCLDYNIDAHLGDVIYYSQDIIEEKENEAVNI